MGLSRLVDLTSIVLLAEVCLLGRSWSRKAGRRAAPVAFSYRGLKGSGGLILGGGGGGESSGFLNNRYVRVGLVVPFRARRSRQPARGGRHLLNRSYEPRLYGRFLRELPIPNVAKVT